MKQCTKVEDVIELLKESATKSEIPEAVEIGATSEDKARLQKLADKVYKLVKAHTTRPSEGIGFLITLANHIATLHGMKIAGFAEYDAVNQPEMEEMMKGLQKGKSN